MHLENYMGFGICQIAWKVVFVRNSSNYQIHLYALIASILSYIGCTSRITRFSTNSGDEIPKNSTFIMNMVLASEIQP